MKKSIFNFNEGFKGQISIIRKIDLVFDYNIKFLSIVIESCNSMYCDFEKTKLNIANLEILFKGISYVKIVL